MGAEEPKILDTVKRQVATAFETFTAGEYRVTPLPADHCYTERALIYLVEKGDKALLYAHDTGYFLDGVWDYLAARKDLRLGLVSLDCTPRLRREPAEPHGFSSQRPGAGTGW